MPPPKFSARRSMRWRATVRIASREIERGARIAALVCDDGQLFARLGEPQHRLDEIRAER
jgi:hypothetical protein